MASKEARERRLKEIQEIAAGWGKIIAQEAFPNGPGMDVSLADMEELAMAASRALVKGTNGTVAIVTCFRCNVCAILGGGRVWVSA